MVNIDSALKTIYKNDRFPLTSTIADKDLVAHFQDLSLTVAADQFAEDKGEFEVNENICTNGDIIFGKCNSSMVKFTLANVTDAIKDREFDLSQTVNNLYSIPLGLYKVETVTKQDDLIFKDVVAFDRMKKIDIDVASWYNGLFPIGAETYTLAQFRASFLAYVGLTEDISKLPLPNDTMTVTKTIEPAELPGRDVIEAIEEINGVFGHISRSGEFAHIALKPMSGMYPSSNLYPSDTLYPVSEDDTTYSGNADETITADMREFIRFEEYSVSAIDKLVIRSDEADFGAIVGTGTNAYYITGNFLLFGKSATELEAIATNTSGYIFKRPHRPYESEQIGLPYLEVGDLLLHENEDAVKGYVLNRTLKGIQALRDSVSATGAKELQQTTSVNRQFKVLDYKTLKIKKDVDGVLIEVEDLRQETSTSIEQLSNRVVLKVNTAGNIGFVSLDGDPDTDLTQIKLKADSISLEGIVTVNNKFKVLEDGTIEAVDGKFSGQLFLQLNSSNATIFGNDGSSNFPIIAYTTEEFGGSYYNSLVLGGDSVPGLKVKAQTIQVRSSYTALQGTSIVTMTTLSGGTYKGVAMSYPNFYPLVDGISLGTSSAYWDSFYANKIYHKSGGTLGFYGSTPSSKTSIATLSASATLTDVINKINSMINNSHGMW
ncbi:MAG: hypothetical protein K0R34_2456 [Herbinix sp.]|jgi:hypothetical protein|nr:hypothetical protein [Herbinix sp.]